MNNIEILEDYIKLINKGYCEDCNELCNIYGTPAFPSKAIAQAIENLIKENKELKEKAKNTIKIIGANYIHKDKVKAMLEGITKEHSSILSKDIYSLNDKNIATFQYNAMRKILEELLEEGE